MFKNFFAILVSTYCAILGLEIAFAKPARSQQTVTQPQTTTPGIGDNSNNNLLNASPNQNNNNNNFSNNFPEYPDRLIYPLNVPIDTPVNTENDWGLNLSVGVNTLDSSNLTVYMGIIFQPGRTNSHNVRMERIRKETQLLEAQRQVSEAQLRLIQKQIEEAEMRLQRVQQSPPDRSSNPQQ